MLGEAEAAVLVWSMGVTQHASGEDNVRAIVNLGARPRLRRARGLRADADPRPLRRPGRRRDGLLRDRLPGRRSRSTEENAAALARAVGLRGPGRAGLTAPEMIDAAGRGELDLLFAVGGNFLEVLPDPERGAGGARADPAPRPHGHRRSRARCWSSPASEVLLLPATTRYEIPGGVTETTHRAAGHPQPRDRGTADRARRARSGRCSASSRRARGRSSPSGCASTGTAAIRDEIARGRAALRGIEELREQGDQFQYGGPHLCAGWDFPTAGRQAPTSRRGGRRAGRRRTGCSRSRPGAASSSTRWSRSAATRSPAPCARRS